MSRNLILIIAIFCFWLYTYLTNISEEEKAEEFKNNMADDGVKYTSNKSKTTNLIINPVKA